MKGKKSATRHVMGTVAVELQSKSGPSRETPKDNTNATAAPADDGENSLPSNAETDQTANQDESDGSTPMDVDEEQATPPRLPNFKKATSSVASSSADSQSIDGDDDMEDAKKVIANAKLNLKQIDQRILRLSLQAHKTLGAASDALKMAAKPQRAMQQHMITELEEAIGNLIDSSSPLTSRQYDNDSEQSYSTTGSNLDAATLAFRRGLPMKLQSHWPRYSGNGRSSAYSFFDDFMRQVRPELGEDRFKIYGPTYLALLVTNGHFQDGYKKHLANLKDKKLHTI